MPDELRKSVDYSAELRNVPESYSRVLAMSEADFQPARERVRGRRAFMVASGGAMPAAVLAARLHRDQVAKPAEAVSALQFVERHDPSAGDALILFSSKAKHPDTAMAAAHGLARGLQVILITQRPAKDLSGVLAHQSVTTLTIEAANTGDGFLATGSVMGMATAVLRIYESADLPPVLPGFTASETLPSAARVLVLHGLDGQAAAIDIEVRLHELGLASVEVTDFRNFAHGRHVGLSRRAADTEVLALISPSSLPLASKTLKVIPAGVRTTVVQTPLKDGLAALDLLSRVLSVPKALAIQQDVEPARPHVPAFGRTLYNLPFKRAFPLHFAGPVKRKLAAADLPTVDVATSNFYRKAFEDWVLWARQQPIKALVLDYDGTCVETTDRLQGPPEDVRIALTQLLDAGVAVAVATGRGDSVQADLQKWIPEKHWDFVLLGLHNGSELGALSHKFASGHEPKWASAVEDELAGLRAAGVMTIRKSGHQVTVSPTPSTSLTALQLGNIVRSVAVRVDSSNLQVATSGHSVDVFEASAGKGRVVAQLQHLGAVLAIGDQGNVGGNDFNLLSSTRLSVSVDECSPDPTRCWNLSRDGQSGPTALLQTLNALKPKGNSMYLSAIAREN